MPLPEGFIEELKMRNSLEDVIGQYATLKRAGSNLVCCCPFHSEKTPSFTLFSQSNSFYCFGCGAGGDVITFVMRMENLDYMSAVEFLANRAGLPMPQNSPFGGKKVDKKRFYEMNAKAAKFWFNNLSRPEGKKGLDYLLGRGLSMSVIRRFGIGYAADSFDALTSYLLKEGYRAGEIKEAFLGGIGKNGKPFDYFRNRAMFPIIDVAGNVVAFSGRFVGEMGENDRKYFNTNDTPVFKKSRTIFALNLAKNAPGRELILCEGNVDAVSLHAAGIPNAVASLGTALTSEQCRLLARWADTVYICYDADSAGKRATHKAIRLLNEAGVKVRVITLDGKNSRGEDIKDPDDFIRAFGKEAFLKKKDAAPGYLEYLFNEIRSKYTLETMDDKNAFLSECFTMLAGVYSPIEREIYIGKMHSLTGVSESVLKAQADQKTGSHLRKAQKDAVEETVRRQAGWRNAVNPDKAKFVSSAVKEEGILGILLLLPEYLSDPKTRALLDVQNFSCEFCRRALAFLLETTKNGETFDFARLNEVFEPDEVGELEGMKRRRAQLENNTPAVLRELTERLAEEAEKKKIRSEPLSEEWLEKLKAKKS